MLKHIRQYLTAGQASTYPNRTTKSSGYRTRHSCGFFVPRSQGLIPLGAAIIYGGLRAGNTTPSGNSRRRLDSVVETRLPSLRVGNNLTNNPGGHFMPAHQLLEICADLDATLSDIQSNQLELSAELLRARELCSLLLKHGFELKQGHADFVPILRATRIIQAGNALCAEMHSLMELQQQARGGVLSLGAIRVRDWKAALREARLIPEGK